MGAYYTKEDITEYITKNTVLPFLLERTREHCKVAFQPDGPVWSLFSSDPDRYIYPAVRKGVIDGEGNVIPLTDEIEPGVADVSKRGGWNRPAPAPYNLPTETWREHVARRQRCLELRDRLRNGEVREVNDLITYNLNIRQFAQDVIEQSEGPDVVKAFYDAIEQVSVLDPTCGSGAFLFASLQVLEPLYEACLDRMAAWLDDEERLDRRHPGHRFRSVLESVAKHPNREYFIYKSIVINNLYGIDIMEEAVEICKLRLFLKLVSTVETAEQVEPLPDVDFNIRAGNTLVGFTSLEAVKDAMTVDSRGNRRLLFEEEEQQLREIEESAAFADRAYQHFRDQQTAFGGAVTAADKKALRDQLDSLDEKLNHYLARQYGKDPAKPAEYQPWRESHHPLHWFVEFYGIMRAGGFDSIVGNPPYVEYSKVRGTYAPLGFSSLPCGNLYTLVLERAVSLLGAAGGLGMIVPLSFTCTDRMREARELIAGKPAWVSTYDIRPSSLFEGVTQRLAITVVQNRPSPLPVQVAGYRRWMATEREHLLPSLAYSSAVPAALDTNALFQQASPLEAGRVSKLPTERIGAIRSNVGTEILVHRIVRYFIKALDFVPQFRNSDPSKTKSDDYKAFCFPPSTARATAAVINSSLFYWYWRASGDGFHCGYADVDRFPNVAFSGLVLASANELFEQLMRDVTSRSALKRIGVGGKAIEYQEFYFSASKPLLDQIDSLLAKHLGLSAAELDFIINYDIKYRMGAEDGDDEA